MRILAVAGPSGVGKTRLLSRLIPALARRGLCCAVIKHSHHDTFDRPGADSERLQRAGSQATCVLGPTRMVLFLPALESPRALARWLPKVDLVLCEGFKSSGLPKVEVHRQSVSARFLCALDRRVFAVVTDAKPPRALPRFGADEVEALAELLALRVRRPTRPGRRKGGVATARAGKAKNVGAPGDRRGAGPGSRRRAPSR